METLSVRESEVIFEVIKGKGVKEVANDLHISFFTADKHLKNAREKTGAKNMAELVFIYLKKNKHLLACLFITLQVFSIGYRNIRTKKNRTKYKISRVKTLSKTRTRNIKVIA